MKELKMKSLMRTSFIALVIFFSIGGRAIAGDGNYLLRACSKGIELPTKPSLVDTREVGYCLGMMEGAIALNHIYRTRPGTYPLFCYPPEATNMEQAARIVVKWLKANPEKLHAAAALCVVLALSEAFPCK